MVAGACAALFAQAQDAPDACALASSAQLNALLGTSLPEGKPGLKGVRCRFEAPGRKQRVELEMIVVKDEKFAARLLDTDFKGYTGMIERGQPVLNVYSALKAFPAAGDKAYVLTGEGFPAVGLEHVRMRFGAGNRIVTVNTMGIARAQVIARLPALHAALRTNLR
jgi:hypothetical protein